MSEHPHSADPPLDQAQPFGLGSVADRPPNNLIKQYRTSERGDLRAVCGLMDAWTGMRRTRPRDLRRPFRPSASHPRALRPGDRLRRRWVVPRLRDLVIRRRPQSRPKVRRCYAQEVLGAKAGDHLDGKQTGRAPQARGARSCGPFAHVPWWFPESSR
jgi:hypothetical protein